MTSDESSSNDRPSPSPPRPVQPVRSPPSRADPPARRGTRSPYAWTRRAAAGALAQIRHVPDWLQRIVASALLRSLGDTDPRTRDAAARALGHLAGPLVGEATERLMCTIDDTNAYVCASAIQALGFAPGRVGPRPSPRLASTTPTRGSSRRRSWPWAGSGHPRSPRTSSASWTRKQPHILASAATARGHARPPARRRRSSEATLRALIRADPEPHTTPGRQLWTYHLPRCHMNALVQLDDREAVPLLLEIARNHVGLRSTATAALRELAPRRGRSGPGLDAPRPQRQAPPQPLVAARPGRPAGRDSLRSPLAPRRLGREPAAGPEHGRALAGPGRGRGDPADGPGRVEPLHPSPGGRRPPRHPRGTGACPTCCL